MDRPLEAAAPAVRKALEEMRRDWLQLAHKHERFAAAQSELSQVNHDALATHYQERARIVRELLDAM